MTDLTSLPQLEVEIKFYLGQTAQNIIEVGKRLIQAKSLVQHGQWQQWLNDNFQLTDRTAQRFMQISERFSKTVDVDGFKPSQLTELLALPDAEETERFIEQKAAEGKERQLSTLKQNIDTVSEISHEREETPIEQPTAKRDTQAERQNTTNYQWRKWRHDAAKLRISFLRRLFCLRRYKVPTAENKCVTGDSAKAPFPTSQFF